jgi:hypothetical protein
MSCVAVRNCIVVALMSLSSLAGAAVLECPLNAPSEWKAGKSRLDRVRVLAYVPGGKAGDKGLPEGMPEKEWQQGGTLFQSWKLKTGRRPLAYQVDCLYVGTARFVRFDARSAGRCVAKRRLRGDALMPGSMEFRCR